MVNFLVNKNEYNCQNFFLMLINSVSRKYALYRKEKSTQQKWIKVFLTLYKLKGLIVSFIHLGARRCVCVMCITFRLKILKGEKRGKERTQERMRSSEYFRYNIFHTSKKCRHLSKSLRTRTTKSPQALNKHVYCSFKRPTKWHL